MANGAETDSVVDQVTEIMDPDKVNQLLEIGKELVIEYGIKVLAAIAIFIIGKITANWLKKFIIKVMKKADVDQIIIGFTSSIAYIAMMAFVIVAVLGQLGIQTTSFIAILGAAGLAVGGLHQAELEGLGVELDAGVAPELLEGLGRGQRDRAVGTRGGHGLERVGDV